MALPTLYKTVKSGREQTWSIWTKNGYMHHQFGFVDGKMRDPIARECQAKNVGRANATTAEEQSVKEALAKWKKHLEKGYAPKCKEGLALAGDAIQHRVEHGSNKVSGKAVDRDGQILVSAVEHSVKIMKGKRYDKYKGEMGPGFVQPKFDGVRCKVSLQDDGVAMTSSSGKQFVFLSHIKDALETALTKWGKPLVLDGECYKHGVDFNLVTACCRTTRSSPHTDEQTMEYHIFDIHSDDKQSVRLAILEEFFATCVDDDMPLVLCHTEPCDGTDADLQDALGRYEKLGYEGIIFRFQNGIYNTKSLHVNEVLKYKSFHDEEFEIIGGKEGKGTEKGKIVWKCTCPGGDFDVRMTGTREACRDLYDRKDEYIGSMLTVKYQEKSPKGVPRFPTGVSVRDYE